MIAAMKTKNIPKVAIVGRPNVGKSALFNRVCKKRIAIVDEAEGITRDRLYAVTELFERPFEIIDTGGIDIHSKEEYSDHIRRQAEIAIEEADSLIMVVDSQIGITTLDEEVAKVLFKTTKPVCLAVNKIDDYSKESQLYEFAPLGISKMVAVSATQNWQVAELLEAALAPIPRSDEEVIDDGSISLAIVGRPNVGKSSLVNYLLDEERCVVSPVAGTTRDSIDVQVTHGDQKYTLIDTAGIRRKHAEHEVVDKFAALRTERAIERADVCLLMLDSREGMTTQEKRIAKQIEESGKGCILLFNKWDLVKGFRMEHCIKNLQDELPFLKHCPKVFISATTGRNVESIFAQVVDVVKNYTQRITTGQLNKFLVEAIQRTHPPMIKGKRLRIYYMAQVNSSPPRFVLFINYPDLMTESYKKYLYNQFRKEFGFVGVPLVFHLRGKGREAVTAVPN